MLVAAPPDEHVHEKLHGAIVVIEDKGIEEKEIWEEVQRRRQILKWMKENNIRYYVDVGKIIQKYYSNPDEVLKNI